VVSALALFAFVALFVISSSTSGTYEMRAQFSDVRGLIPGGEVRAGAVAVGQVTDVELNEEVDLPEVTFRVDDDFRLHEGATVDIRLGSNVGAVNRAIELEQGDPATPRLPDGYTFSEDETDQPVNFDLAVETLDPPTRADMKALLIGLDDAIKGRGGDFDRTLERSSAATNETANLLAQVSSDGESLRTLVGEGERVVRALASSPGDLAEVADRTAALLVTTGNRQAELAESVQRIGPALRGGREALDRLAAAAPNLRETVRGLGPVVAEAGPLVRLLPDATSAGGPFVRETRKLVEGGPRDLRKFLPIIVAADPVTEQLDSVARAALPLGQELRVYAPEIIGAFQNFGAASGTYDAVGHILTVASGNAQNPPSSTFSTTIDQTQCTPGLLELPFIRAPGALECDPWTDYENSFIYPSDERP
jgi:virulence factor Mce-like protein